MHLTNYIKSASPASLRPQAAKCLDFFGDDAGDDELKAGFASPDLVA